jgi:hypothetical protein
MKVPATASLFRRPWLRSRWIYVLPLAVAAGCGAFNPAFLALLDAENAEDYVTVDNPPGHVIVAFVNNTEMDERLINYLAPQLGLSEAEIRELRPRVRMRLQVTFTDGSAQEFEFVDGTPGIVDPDFDAEAFADLNQNTLNNVVNICDVASVTLAPGSTVEVFMPVELLGFQLVEGTTPGGGTSQTWEQRTQIAPAFRDLELDEVDEDGNVVVQRNVGIRDTVAPTTNVLCGSVIAVIISGTLTAPFLDVASSDPSFDIEDEATIARIGGRYEFNVSVQ